MKQQVVTIGVDQSLSNSYLHEHRCMEKLISYTNPLVNVMINNRIIPFLEHKWSPLLRNLLTTVQFHLAYILLSKSLVQGNHSVEVFYFKQKTYFLRLGSAKSNHKAIIAGSTI